MADSQYNLDPADILERLSRTALARDPSGVSIDSVDRDWPTGLRARLTANLKPAGVLIPIIDRPDGLSVLLTRRSAELKHHAGQVSFPGGRMEPDDEDILATALRETHEEVGIHPKLVQVGGFLPPMPTITGFAVTPVVGLLLDGLSVRIDRTEVERAFEVPLRFLLDPENEQTSSREIDGVRLALAEFHFDGERIWGATASMVIALRQYLVI
jgi:8-oxo-dGTP pyrophosphatase MutT (NUDIX family)